MNTHGSRWVLVVLLVLGVGLWWEESQSAADTGAVVTAPGAGRFQFSLRTPPEGGGYSTVFVLDSVTGECWYRSAAPKDQWVSIGSPVIGREPNAAKGI